jgi:hypothetical protein
MCCATVLVSATLVAQTLASAKAKTVRAKARVQNSAARVTAEEVEALRQALASQRDITAKQGQQLREVREEMQRLTEQLRQVQASATEAQSRAGVVATTTTQQSDSIAKLQTDMTSMRASLASTDGAVQEVKKRKIPAAVESGFGNIKFNGLLQLWGATGDQGFKDTFRLRRTELKFSGNITPQVKWTVMIDPSKALSLNTTTAKVNGTSFLTSASVNQSGRILQDVFLTVDYIPHIHVDFGQTKIPLSMEGLQSSAKLDVVERALFIVDKARGGGYGDIRDTGLIVSGAITKYVDVTVGEFNGSGERQNDVAVNDQKATVGRVVLKPVKGLQFGGSGAFGNAGDRPDRPRRDRLGAELAFVRGPFTFKSEWMEGKDGNILRQGYYVHGGYRIAAKFEPVFRFDTFDPDVSHKSMTSSNLPERDYIVGLNYFVTENHWKLQANYVRKTFTKDIVTSKNLVLLNLQTSW